MTPALPFVVGLCVAMFIRIDVDEIACPRDVRDNPSREIVVGRLFTATGANILIVRHCEFDRLAL
jgi:hypothetical protein